MLAPYVITRKNGINRESDIFSAMLDDRVVFICGEINNEMATNVVAELLYLEAKNPQQPISLYINSVGGDVAAGLAIYDTMRHVSSEIHTLCIGQACSMAAVLLASGDKRSALPSSRIMIHQPRGGMQGTQSEIVIYADEITRLRKKLVEILSKKTGKKPSQIEKDIDKDFYMDALSAVSYGIIDEILPEKEKKGEKE